MTNYFQETFILCLWGEIRGGIILYNDSEHVLRILYSICVRNKQLHLSCAEKEKYAIGTLYFSVIWPISLESQFTTCVNNLQFTQ